MSNLATGSFDVALTPCEGDEPAMGRMLINKRYKGDLAGIGKGQMLSSRSTVEGSAGYVAMELFEGSVEDKFGTFVLLHKGLMNRGESTLRISVVPDSGTGELVGITGEMTIDIAEAVHNFAFDYSLAN